MKKPRAVRRKARTWRAWALMPCWRGYDPNGRLVRKLPLFTPIQHGFSAMIYAEREQAVAGKSIIHSTNDAKIIRVEIREVRPVAPRRRKP